MKATNSLPKHSWRFYLLWPNVAVAVVYLVALASNQFPSAREFARALLHSLVFANLTCLIGIPFVLLLAKKLALRKLPVLFLLCVLVAVPVAILVVTAFLAALGFGDRQHFWPQYFQAARVSVPLAAIFGAGAMVHASLRERVQSTEEKLREKEIAEERARKLAVEARLQSLESRIHPHFLFNTLNSISSLIPVNPALAEQTVGRLATLLRASLDKSTKPLIPLSEELAMVESYLDIERLRFGDKLRGSVEVPTELQNAGVPPMSVLSLVENAVKHGISAQSSGGEVMVAASVENGSLRIEVRDTGRGFDLTAINAGHGLDNLVERLEATFGEKARLNVVQRDSRCVVEMVIPRL